MKKRILLIHRGYPLGGNAGDKVRTLNMAISLQNLGYQVILLAFFTKGLSFLHTEKKNTPAGIKIIFAYSLPNRLGLAKIAAFLRSIYTRLICDLYSIDLIQAELSSSATSVRFVKRLPLITDFHSDIVPELEMDSYPQRIVAHAASENKYALKRSKGIITVSENLKNNLRKYGPIPKKNYILPCNFDPVPFQKVKLADRDNLRDELGLKNRIVLCYSGGLHTWQCIAETLDLVIRLRELNPAYFFCLFTNDDTTPYSSLLKKLEGAYMVKGLQKEEVPLFLSIIDVGFVLRANSLVNLNASPTKGSEYLASGAMIVTTRYAGDVPQQVEDSQCGIVFDELLVNEKELATVDEKIRAYYSRYSDCSQKAKDYVYSNRTWDSNEEKLAQLYNEINL